jgi:hypothetical protein
VNHRCCEPGSSSRVREKFRARIAIGNPRPLARRCLDAAKWIASGAMLALVPKCPMCLVAYFAVGAGIGISMSTAVYLRLAMVGLCTASLSYYAASRGRHFLAQLAARHESQPPALNPNHPRAVKFLVH